ncbi:hypothetical protein [Xanthobacter agilis]|uniref:Uncharacterized protein n=1 Tax=Xanthobacter agilis TaxID=47492 RepID=A0ABU0LJ64_XANAG|nr:hypothetical protein [Xanthobacter agilis]MDQ0507166.1 hypothetical protein [Xanthobacter agilis]
MAPPRRPRSEPFSSDQRYKVRARARTAQAFDGAATAWCLAAHPQVPKRYLIRHWSAFPAHFSTPSSAFHFLELAHVDSEAGVPYNPPIDDALPPTQTGG